MCLWCLRWYGPYDFPHKLGFVIPREGNADGMCQKLCGMGGLIAWIICCKNGYGRHQDTIPPRMWVVLLEAQFFQSVIEASFAFGFLKISIALSLLRLSRGTRYKWILWTLVGKCPRVVLPSLSSFLSLHVCLPLEKEQERLLTDLL